jgi:hypothetical protein
MLTASLPCSKLGSACASRGKLGENPGAKVTPARCVQMQNKKDCSLTVGTVRASRGWDLQNSSCRFNLVYICSRYRTPPSEVKAATVKIPGLSICIKSPTSVRFSLLSRCVAAALFRGVPLPHRPLGRRAQAGPRSMKPEKGTRTQWHPTEKEEKLVFRN